MEAVALSAEDRKAIVSKTIGLWIRPHGFAYELLDGGDVVYLIAIMNGEESRPGATISKDSGAILSLDSGITAARIDTVLREIYRWSVAGKAS